MTFGAIALLWVPSVTYYYFMALPPVVLAIFLGRMVNRRISGRSFLLCVHVGLIVIGAVLLFQSMQ